MITYRHTPLRDRRGFTLIETMMAMFVLAILAATVVSSVFLTRRATERAVYDNMAFTVAQGFLEQYKSMDWDLLKQSIVDPNKPLRLVRAGIQEGVPNSIVAENVYFGQWNPKPDPDKPDDPNNGWSNILIDLQREGYSDNRTTGLERDVPIYMRMRFQPRIVTLEGDATPLEAAQIVLEFEYQVPEGGQLTAIRDEVRAAVANMSNF